MFVDKSIPAFVLIVFLFYLRILLLLDMHYHCLPLQRQKQWAIELETHIPLAA